MDTLTFKTFGWLALALIARMGTMATADQAFAVHMSIAGAAAPIASAWGMRTADYAVLQGLKPAKAAPRGYKRPV